MKRILIVVALVLTACTGNFRSANVPESRSGGLKVVKLEPATGAFVDAGTVIRATLAYSVPPGNPGEYMVLVQFEEWTDKRSTGGPASWSQVFDATGERSTIDIEYPLKDVIARAEVAKPLKMRFLLTYMTAAKRAHSVADVGPFSYGVR